MKRTFCCLMAMLLAAPWAAANLSINEIYFSPEEPKEDRQFFEIYSTIGATSLNDIWFLEIEGDFPLEATQLDNPGQVLHAFNLSSFSTGTNGLFLWQGSNTVIDIDPVTAGVQGPAATTVVERSPFPRVFGYEEEGPDDELIHENNVHTFLLVEGFTGAVGDDLDGDDDGTLDIAWSAFLDGISQAEDGDAGYQYASQFGGKDVLLWFGGDVFQRRPSDGLWMFFDSSSGEDEDAGYPGPFFANDGSGPGDSDAGFENGTEIVVNPASTFLYATPGGLNVQVPEPGPALLAAISLLFGFVTRRK